jgi:tRNA(fMet)-specific endonuclease VapC
MIGLDTNVVVHALSGRSPAVRRRLDARVAGGDTLAIPVIVLFELEFGIAKSDRAAENRAKLRAFMGVGIEVWPFEAEDAAEAGSIRAALERAGTPIGAYDTLIAAQARRRGALLVTSNCKEFARVPGLATEDWTA